MALNMSVFADKYGLKNRSKLFWGYFRPRKCNSRGRKCVRGLVFLLTNIGPVNRLNLGIEVNSWGQKGSGFCVLENRS